MTRIKLLLADDQALVRGALGALLDLEPDLYVVAQVGSGDEVLAAVAEHRPDVCLLDIQMPGLDGIEVARLLREQHPEVGVLMVTTFNRPGHLRQSMEAGATGFVVKDAPSEELAAAVRKVAAGVRVVDPALAAESLSGGPSPLTPREVEVLRLAHDGLPINQLASRVFLSPGTVRNLLSSTIHKTGASNRIEAARIARDRGWI